MAILQSVDGKFYEVSDEDLEQYAVAEDKVNELMGEAGGPEGPGGPGGPGGQGPGGQQGPGASASPQVVIHVSSGGQQQPGGQDQGPPQGAEGEQAGVQPYGRRRRRHWWHNYWSNCWRNCWRNCY